MTLFLFFIFAGKVEVAQSLSPAVKGSMINLNHYKDNLPQEQTIEALDSQEQNKPDTFIVFRMVDGAKVLQAHLFDLNRDGNIDIVKHFKNGKLHKVEASLSKDGQIFSVSEYDTESGLEIRKDFFDQLMLKTRFSYNGQIRREEFDQNLDGKTDRWIHYKNGKVVATE